MRRISAMALTVITLLVAALPALAQEGEDPLANAVLLPGVVGWILAALAAALFLLLLLWSARGPR